MAGTIGRCPREEVPAVWRSDAARPEILDEIVAGNSLQSSEPLTIDLPGCSHRGWAEEA